MKPIDRFWHGSFTDSISLAVAGYRRVVLRRSDSQRQKRQHVQLPRPTLRNAIDLRGKKVTLRHERHHKGKVIVYQNERRIGQARLLDAVANGMKRRTSAEER